MSRVRIGALIATAAIVVAACGGTTATTAPASEAPPASVEPGATAAPATEAPREQAAAEGRRHPRRRHPRRHQAHRPGAHRRQQHVLRDAAGHGGPRPAQARHRPASSIPAWPRAGSSRDDGLTYTFKIREGVKFHDGTAVDAEAIKYNYDRWLNFPQRARRTTATTRAPSSAATATASNIASTAAPDPSTFTITLKSPVSSFLLSQTLTPFVISSPTALKAGRRRQHGHRTSPRSRTPRAAPADGRHRSLQVQELDPRRQRHDRQEPRLLGRRERRPYLDEVVFKPVAEESQRLNGLSTGELDLVQTIAPDRHRDDRGRPRARRSSTAASPATCSTSP